ncbi:MAG TPA: DinB family protein [Chitinophagaceae bacterium]|nr:DinB family protein [Chitinophagaceae bacterium]
MKGFFKELFEYNHHFNEEVISVLNENKGKASEKCMSLLSHILNVHQIWNGKFQPELAPYGSWEIHQIQGCHEINSKNFEGSILIIDKYDLNRMIQYSNSKGHIFNNTARDILFQIINHSTYHRAQIATEFRQNGLEPILTDYIYYKMT